MKHGFQAWEYKTLFRERGWEDATKEKPWHEAGPWNIQDWENKLNNLGKEGWELVSISPRSGYVAFTAGITSRPNGFTSEELWVFKRPNCDQQPR